MANSQSQSFFRLACRMLRLLEKLDFRDLPPPRQSESLVDWLVRSGVAKSPQAAADGLLVAAGLRELCDEVWALPEMNGGNHD